MLRDVLAASKTRNGELHDENQYLSIIDSLLETGRRETGRNGEVTVDTGAAMHFSLRDGTIPIFTTKRVAWKTCLKELLWFIRGSTDATELSRAGVRIWDGNGTREFLDQRGLTKNRVGDLGPVYGHQWRFFNAPYSGADVEYTGSGVDQLQNIVDALKDPSQHSSRRLIMSAWNPAQLNEMALPPCHILAQFHVSPKKELSCSLYQRSADMALGVPFNVASYSFLTHLLAYHCGLKVGEFVHHLGNCHIYAGHEEGLQEQLKRMPLTFPKLKVGGQLDCPRDKIDEYGLGDFCVTGYDHHPSIKFPFCA
jgi:thymidylate synthase